MPIFVDGVQINTVFVDGVEQTEVWADGVQVFSSGSSFPFIVTQGLYDLGAGYFYFGYLSGNVPNLFPGTPAFGSVAPPSVNGAAIEITIALETGGLGTDTMLFSLAGNRAQSFFDGITFEGIVGEFLSGAAVAYGYDATDDVTWWQWNNDPVSPLWDGSGNLNVSVRFA